MFTQHCIVLRRSENHTRYSLRSRCLEVVGARKNERTRGRHACPRVSFSRAHSFLGLLPRLYRIYRIGLLFSHKITVVEARFL